MNLLKYFGYVAAVGLLNFGAAYVQASEDKSEERVLVMEQFHIPTYIPHYRIEISESGSGIYTGYDLVKNKGPVKFQLTATQIARIFAEFKERGFWEMPTEFAKSKAPQYNGNAHWFAIKTVSSEKGVQMSVSDSSWPMRHILKNAIEREVNSAQWRCPHKHADSTEVCVVERQFSEDAVKHFEMKKGALK